MPSIPFCMGVLMVLQRPDARLMREFEQYPGSQAVGVKSPSIQKKFKVQPPCPSGFST